MISLEELNGFKTAYENEVVAIDEQIANLTEKRMLSVAKVKVVEDMIEVETAKSIETATDEEVVEETTAYEGV